MCFPFGDESVIIIPYHRREKLSRLRENKIINTREIIADKVGKEENYSKFVGQITGKLLNNLGVYAFACTYAFCI